jgi:hypothetical protein
LLLLATTVVTYHLFLQRGGRDSRSWFRLQTALFGEAALYATSWTVLGTQFSANVRIVQVWDFLLLLSGIWMATGLARWPLRGWWAGPLLLDISRKWQSARIDRFFFLVVYLFMFVHVNLAEAIWIGLLLGHLFPSHRAEMRQRGILSPYGGRLIRWRSIEAFDWREYHYQPISLDPSFSVPSIVPRDRWPWARGEGGLMALKLRRRLRFPIFRGLQSWLGDRVILVPAERKAAAEAILSEQIERTVR